MKFNRDALEKLPANVLAEKRPRSNSLSNLISTKKGVTERAQLFTLECHDGTKIKDVPYKIFDLLEIPRKKANKTSNKITLDNPLIDGESLQLLISYLQPMVQKENDLTPQDIINKFVQELEEDGVDRKALTSALMLAHSFGFKIFIKAITQSIQSLNALPDPKSETLENSQFARKDSLTQHEKTHTGERPFECNECGKAFSQKSNLTTHMIIHSGELPFACSKCNKGFTTKGNCSKHMKTCKK